MKLSEIKNVVSTASKTMKAAKTHLDQMQAALDNCTNWATLGGHEMNVIHAQKALNEQREEFAKVFQLAAFSIFLEGDKSAELAELVQEQTPSVKVDFSDLLQDIINPIRQNCRTTMMFGSFELGIVKAQASNWASFYLLPPPDLQFQYEVYVGNEEGTALDETKMYNAVCDILSQLQPEYFKVLIQDLAVARAMSLDIDSSVVPVLVCNVSAQLRNRLESMLFEGRFLVHKTSKTPSEEEAVSLLKQVKTAVNSKNNQKE